MEPIISPWIIYAVNLFASIHILCCVILTVSSVVCIVTLMAGLCEEDEKYIKIAKILAVIVAISAALLIVIPDKDILLAMLATSYITPDNIQIVQGDIVDFIRQISEALQK